MEYYETDVELSLQENLSGKDIVEFPTFILIAAEAGDGYRICKH